MNEQSSDTMFDELQRDNIDLNYTEERMTELQEIRVMQARLEEILLNSIYERLTKDLVKYDELDSDFGKGYYEGYSDCAETLWNIIQEHNDNNNYNIKRNG